MMNQPPDIFNAVTWYMNESEETVTERVTAILRVMPEAALIRTESGHTPLHWAASQRLATVISLLLSLGADVNAQDNFGKTPLESALLGGGRHASKSEPTIPIARLLLEHGADPNQKGEQDRPALFCAMAVAGHLPQPLDTELIELFLSFGADPMVRDTDRGNILYCVQNAGLLRLLLAHAPELASHVNDARSNGLTPLMLVAADHAYDPTLLDALCRVGANVNAADDKGFTALHYLCIFCPFVTKSLECLLKSGADLNARTNENMTPLHMAAGAHSVRGIKTLMRWGADPFARDLEGKTPRERVAENWYYGDEGCHYAPPPYGEAYGDDLRRFRWAKARVVRALKDAEQQWLERHQSPSNVGDSSDLAV